MNNNIKRKVGRPIGSTTKNKLNNNNNFKIINLNRDVENTPIINSDSPYQYVPWGAQNDFPLYILNLYANSIIHSSCVNFIVNAITGDGVDYEKMQITESELIPNVYESWNDVIRKISLDYVLFGGFALQIIKNKDNQTFSFFHQPICNIRLGHKDEYGEIKKAYICQNWKYKSRYGVDEIDILNFNDDENLKIGKPYLFIYYNYNIFDEYYSQPYYSSAFQAIEADVAMKKFDLCNIKNNFTPSGAIILNRVDDETERESILREINNSFTDEDNANNLMILFKNNVDDVPIEYVPFNSNENAINQYSDNNERTQNRILAAHRIVNKGLIGLPVDSTGFSNEGTLLEVAYQITNKLIINNLRNVIINNLNTILQLNNIDTKIILKPLSFRLDTENVQVQENVNVDNEVNDDNIDSIEIKI